MTRFLQFRLRTLMILFFGLCLIAGWIGTENRKYHLEQFAISQLFDAGIYRTVRQELVPTQTVKAYTKGFL